MDRLIYLAMSGAKATLQRQDQLANNLANASTNGFRAELQAFRAVPVRGDGASTRVYALESSVGHDPRSGPVQTTGRALDVALQGAAWLAVQALDGTEAYTRAGALQVGTDGQLVTPAGLPVLGDGGPITLPANAAVDVASDGTLTTRVGNDPPQPAGRLKLVTTDAPLTRGDDGLFRVEAGELAADPSARLQAGALEGSNVSPVETMVAMIAAARQFEQQMKVLQGAEQREQAASRLLSPQ
ncbi:MAG: flagellar basal-body rod protein FlgF [Rubrivivax sp.]|jgi:flagellar basal-body rod protein FlgF|nr:flagellar basal-body rod protein FlgF [Betaproteobacteria bacterium]MBP6316764.1 flagellar basal-body rod protein FlgF [Rubrivivax sp.]MBK7458909.1 flagellar basal-body rod protein FlgF [Betaproteobacteria bacterium]MBK7514694.1 flagellar basal-body rod protein FlgF [Betaproteobacteria bacterium]MBK9682133.1 flagellar basal-body rod protein FlgF [Betaproteobacteria bacterium]